MIDVEKLKDQKLAIYGGNKVMSGLFPSQNTMGEEEEKAVLQTLKNGRLSGYRANDNSKHFYGGPKIIEFEMAWGEYFNLKNFKASIACNSATSGLWIACAAVGLKKGDEVIVSPWSMTCSASIPVLFNATIVYADIEPDYFCVDPLDILSKITEKTKAIITVDLFGQTCDYDKIKFAISFAEKKYGHKIYLISDTAQAPGSMHQGQYSGTIGDIGIFSFNFGKHMTCGEGGMLVVPDLELNYKCRLMMNNGESVANSRLTKEFGYQENRDFCKGHSSFNVTPNNIKFDYGTEEYNYYKQYYNIVGMNLRMTELQAAIVIEQLKKLEDNIKIRVKNATKLKKILSEQIPAIKIAKIRPNCNHTYYALPFLWDQGKADYIHRDQFIDAVKAELNPRKGREDEGIFISNGYITPLNYMSWSWANNRDQNQQNKLPVVDDLWSNKLFLTILHAPNSTLVDMEVLASAFLKVWFNLDQILRGGEQR
jgi:perosamine synthetase